MEVSTQACIDPSVVMGEDCVVWQFATICAGTVLGDRVVVGSGAWIGKNVRIGAGTRIQHGAFIPNGTRIGELVFIGPNSSMTDDKYPRAHQLYYPEPPILEDYCSIGAGAVILPGVTIGKWSFVGAGAVVVENVPPTTTVMGCPAKVRWERSVI